MTSSATETTSGVSTSGTAKRPSSSGSVRMEASPRKRRENVKEKGNRLLLEGRLRIVKVEGNLVIAECRGDSGAIYALGFDPRNRQWRCTCPAKTACSHLIALQRVTVVNH